MIINIYSLPEDQTGHKSLVAPNVTAQENINHQMNAVGANMTQQETDCNMTVPYQLISHQNVDASAIKGKIFLYIIYIDLFL